MIMDINMTANFTVMNTTKAVVKIRPKKKKKKIRPQWDLNQQPTSMAQFVSTYT